MPNIHSGALLHVPTPPRGRFKAAGDAIKGSKGYQRAQRKFQTATGNATSQRATRKDPGPGGKFGKIPYEDRLDRTDQRLSMAQGGVTGLAIGTSAGVAAGGDTSGRHQKISRNRAAITRNNKKLGEFGKAKVHLITDVGTAAGRATRKLDQGVHPWKAGVAGIGVGAGVTGPLALHTRKKQTTELKRQKGVLVAQRSQLKGIKKSAFGVEH